MGKALEPPDQNVTKKTICADGLIRGHVSWAGNGNLLQHSHLGNPMDRGHWWASLCVLSCFSHVWPCCSSPPSSSVHGIIPGKNTGVDCHALLQGIFPTQGLNPHLLHLLHQQAGCLPLVPPGKPGLQSMGSQRVRHSWEQHSKKKKKWSVG